MSFSVAFVDFWLADQFNSLGLVFLDFEYFMCFYISTGMTNQQSDVAVRFIFKYTTVSTLELKYFTYLKQFD